MFTQLQRAYREMNAITSSVNSRPMPKVAAQMLPPENILPTDVSFYVAPLSTIMVQPYTWEVGSVTGLETIFREFGHHVLTNFAESPLPDYDNGNCDDVIEALFLEIPELGHCKWLAEKDEAAWTEGFPTFLASVLEHRIYGSLDRRHLLGSLSWYPTSWSQPSSIPGCSMSIPR